MWLESTWVGSDPGRAATAFCRIQVQVQILCAANQRAARQLSQLNRIIHLQETMNKGVLLVRSVLLALGLLFSRATNIIS